MRSLFTGERFGRPQIFAALLLLVFIGECGWLLAHHSHPDMVLSDSESDRIGEGVEQWHGRAIAGTPAVSNLSPDMIQICGRFDVKHSPLWYLTGSALVSGFGASPDSWLWLWLTRAPYVFFGTMLGASVWYVARRLYGNAGGYIALSLYCFSPGMIRSSTLWFSPPNIAAVWGAFGAVFTAIAVSHTLYAPREVILWNWRRILLLGISLALAVGSQFSLAAVIPVLVIFMLYLAPERKAAAVSILAFACAIALILLFALYFFHPHVFWQGMVSAQWIDVSLPAATMPGAYAQVAREISASGPVLALLTPGSLIFFALWRRSRYFGNVAPLLMTLFFVALRVLSPHESESVFALAAITMLFVFIAGITADLLETRSRETVLAVITGLLVANALWNLLGLVRIAHLPGA